MSSFLSNLLIFVLASLSAQVLAAPLPNPVDATSLIDAVSARAPVHWMNIHRHRLDEFDDGTGSTETQHRFGKPASHPERIFGSAFRMMFRRDVSPVGSELDELFARIPWSFADSHSLSFGEAQRPVGIIQNIVKHSKFLERREDKEYRREPELSSEELEARYYEEPVPELQRREPVRHFNVGIEIQKYDLTAKKPSDV